MNYVLRSILLSFLAPIFLLSSALGQAVLQDFYSPAASSGAPTDLGGGIFGYEFTLNPETDFSAAGHGKLIFTGSTHEGTRDNANFTKITKVLYNGVELTEAVNGYDNWDIVSNSIFYLDNVVSDGILRVELSSSVALAAGFGLYAVDGLKEGVQDTGATLFLSALSNATVSMTTDSGFYVQQAARNNQSLSDSVDDYETLYNYVSSPVANYKGLAQYQLTTAPGDYLAPVGNAGGNAGGAVAAAFEAVSVVAAELKITSITSLGSGVFELTLTGDVNTAYEFYSSSTLNFTPGTLVENLTQGDSGDAGSIGGTNDSVLTTDGSGDGTVQVTLTGDPADFVRAQNAASP